MDTDLEDFHRARIFLSSGQRPDERAIANAIAARLRGKFRVFITTEVETSKELLEVIFPALLDSDYVVFVDFVRDKIKTKTRKHNAVYRGSLYSHQELALAYFLGMDFASFREEGVESPAGMSSTIMGNGTTFQPNERANLPNLVFDAVSKKVEAGVWSVATRNRLALELVPGSTHECQQGTRHLEYYHIRVTNLHHRKRATNCNAYLESLKVNGRARQVKQVESKWRLTPLPTVSISPQGGGLGSVREFDAFVVERGSPSKVVFETLTDAHKAPWTFDEQGEYEATYVVQSEQFPDSKITLRFNFTGGPMVDWR